MNNIERGFKEWWDTIQPAWLFQNNSGHRLPTAEAITEFKKVLYAAYQAGWRECGEHVSKVLEKRP